MRAKEKIRSWLKQGQDGLKHQRNKRAELIENIKSDFRNPKRPVITGTIVLIPIFVVLTVVDWILDKINQIPLVKTIEMTGIYVVDETIKLLATLFFGAVLFTFTGRLVKTGTGESFERSLDQLMDKIPFLGPIYNVSKLTTDTILNGSEEFSDPVKISFDGVRVTGYRTGNHAPDGKPVIFLPTSPNVTTGLVLEVDENRLETPQETAEQSMTRTISAGFGDTTPYNDDIKRRDMNSD